MLAKRLAAVGLIAPREKQQVDATKLGEFIDAYLSSRTEIKPGTKTNLLQVRGKLVGYFGESKLLADVTPGDADEWRRWLASVSRSVRTPSASIAGEPNNSFEPRCGSG